MSSYGWLPEGTNLGIFLALSDVEAIARVNDILGGEVTHVRRPGREWQRVTKAQPVKTPAAQAAFSAVAAMPERRKRSA